MSTQVLSSQDELATIDNQTFESWNALLFQYAPIDKLSLSLEAQLRLKSVGKTYDKSFFEIKVDYELQPYLEVGAGAITPDVDTFAAGELTLVETYGFLIFRTRY